MRTYHIFHNSFICACCSFHEDLPYLPQLIHLRMLHLSGMRNPLSTKWHDILASTSLLTNLVVLDVNIEIHSHAVVHLPNLQISHVGECSVWLSCLVPQPTCNNEGDCSEFWI